MKGVFVKGVLSREYVSKCMIVIKSIMNMCHGLYIKVVMSMVMCQCVLSRGMHQGVCVKGICIKGICIKEVLSREYVSRDICYGGMCQGVDVMWYVSRVCLMGYVSRGYC